VRLLLDTCTFLWFIEDAPQLSERARELIVDPGNEAFLSTVSIWEIAIKHALGRLPFPEPVGTFIPEMRREHGIEALPLDEESALRASTLPALHRDPFDRMLVCQAITTGSTIVTPDERITRYPVRSVW
jgi:PIN domain nuclease of toxin-antitoxin system